MGFDFDHATRQRLGYKLIDLIDRYFSSLPERAVQLPAEQRSFGELRGSMPEAGEDAEAVLDDLCRELVDQGFHVPSANYFGLMNPTPTYMAVLAEALVAALNPQLATLARSQLASKIESESVRWIGERVFQAGNDGRRFDGTFTSGGNEANFSALALALSAQFPGVMEQGVAAKGVRPVTYASSESHHSLDKSLGLLGLGRRALRRIEVNGKLQLDPARLEEAIRHHREQGFHPFCVVGTAGTTNSGAVDDLEALAAISRQEKLWFHVDAAYGGAVVFSDKHRGLVRGIEQADSVTIDPHKWLAMPFAAGVVLTSRPETLQEAFAVPTPYMPRAAGAPLTDNFKVSFQWSRRMNSLKFWLTLRVHGRQAYEELIDRQLGLARELSRRIAASPHFILASEPVLPILNFRLRLEGASEADAARANDAVVEEVTRSGQRWISETKVAGHSVIRAMIISYLTEQQHLDGLLAALEQAAEPVRAQAGARLSPK